MRKGPEGIQRIQGMQTEWHDVFSLSSLKSAALSMPIDPIVGHFRFTKTRITKDTTSTSTIHFSADTVLVDSTQVDREESFEDVLKARPRQIIVTTTDGGYTTNLAVLGSLIDFLTKKRYQWSDTTMVWWPRYVKIDSVDTALVEFWPPERRIGVTLGPRVPVEVSSTLNKWFHNLHPARATAS